MILLFISTLSISLGAEVGYLKIGDFNQHFRYLSQRAETLGWTGDFGRFRNLQYSPLLQCELFRIEEFSLILRTGYLFDRTSGDFSYLSNTDTFRLKEYWHYWAIPIQFDLCLSLKYFSFFTGIEFFFTNLDIKINKNYGLNPNYTQNFDSEDIGLVIGLTKGYGRFNFGLFFRTLPLDQFHNKDGFLYYSESEGYIYHGPEVFGGQGAVLDFTGAGIKILYRIF